MEHLHESLYEWCCYKGVEYRLSGTHNELLSFNSDDKKKVLFPIWIVLFFPSPPRSWIPPTR